MVHAGVLYGGQLFFTHHHAIDASAETGDDETIDKQAVDKLFAVLERQYP